MQAISIRRGSFSWFGRVYSGPSFTQRQSSNPESTHQELHALISHHLYTNFYCTGSAVSAPILQHKPRTGDESKFVNSISDANSGAGQLQEGWKLTSRQSDIIGLCRREGPIFWTKPSDLLTESVDAKLKVRVSKELLAYSPGFYIALSDKVVSESNGRTFRLYWNLAPNCVVDFVSVLTKLFNRRRIVFTLKVVNSTDRFDRCDSAVMYVDGYDLERSLTELQNIYSIFGPYLRRPVPALTMPLAPGFALAEDPGGGESFGWHRCSLISEALLDAYKKRIKSKEKTLELIIKKFIDSGIDIVSPYRKSHPVELAIDFSTTENRNGLKHTQADLLAVAHELGTSLIHDALWYQGRCTWVGAEPLDIRNPQTGSSTLGPDLYDGVAGIGLFLAELGLRTSDEQCLRCAVGAIRQSFTAASVCPPDTRLGLYSGWMGIALVALRVGRILGLAELQEQANELCLKALAVYPPITKFDVVSGRAGAVLALIGMGHTLDNSFQQIAKISLSDQLLSVAEKSEGGTSQSWHSDKDASTRNLTGYAHGTSGVAHALLEMYAESRDEKYRSAAMQAFFYERMSYDEKVGNWRDLRKKRNHGPQFMSAWCHGAPGMALPRIRAAEISVDSDLQTEMKVALTSTCANLNSRIESVRSDYSLCHGLAGSSDILLEADRRLGPHFDVDTSIIEEVAYEGARLYSKSSRVVLL